ncbi:MAG TPA: sigma-70 family RNA polymerase sigma factor [Candidatus Egerieousia sp.]|nr:sigma-70 family RNA polymerase sigma factor [Candidatus Egerieousia sp.]HPT05263.1 sigma-70 family RNA polymerase sigma factor [Candidatus Egerieousia sp.]
MAKTGSKHTSGAYIMLSDRELIELAQEGKQVAFTLLFERHYEGLMSHITSILSVKGKENPALGGMEPQDACLETFNKAFKHILQYNPKYNFTTWLYNIAKNTALDFVRKRKKEMDDATQNIAGKRELNNIVAGPRDNPEDKLIGSQESEKIMADINHLPEVFRTVMHLYVEDYAYEEIAKETGIPLSSVKVRINRAKNILAKMYPDNSLAQKRSRKNMEKKNVSKAKKSNSK